MNVLVSTATGTSTDYTVTTAVTYDSTDFSVPSFAATAFTMQDGAAADISDGTIYYYYVPKGGYASNGNILAHSDSVMGDWTFTYDAVDRLTSAVPSYSTQSEYSGDVGCWTYDAYGNRTLEAFSTAACSANPTPQSLTTYNAANNQVVNSTVSPNTVSGVGIFIYDGSGNTLYDGTNHYWYDAEGRLCAAESVSTGAMSQYVYDPEGARIAKGTLATAPASNTATCTPVQASAPNGTSSLTSASGFAFTTRWLVSQGGDQVTELAGSPGLHVWTHSNVWAGGKLSATWDTLGVHFELTDPLGTKRVQASALGQVEETCMSLPFGNDVGNPIAANCVVTNVSTADDATEHHFTQKERTQFGTDYFEARYYSSTVGRFLSPDWSAKTEPVPYAQLDNPQSLNLYAYLMNNPLAGVDADGHCFSAGWCDLNGNNYATNSEIKAAMQQARQQTGVVASCPGCTTQKKAALAAEKAALGPTRASVKSGHYHEYGGWILKDSDGKYTYTAPLAGSERTINVDNISVPDGYTAVADYHSHPHVDAAEGEGASIGDIQHAIDYNRTGYVMDSVSGHVYRFGPTTHTAQFPIGTPIGYVTVPQ